MAHHALFIKKLIFVWGSPLPWPVILNSQQLRGADVLHGALSCGQRILVLLTIGMQSLRLDNYRRPANIIDPVVKHLMLIVSFLSKL